MDWNALTHNPRTLLGYYDAAPSLEQVALHRVTLLRDGPTAEIVFNASTFPQRPSPRWPQGANTCQITLRAIGVSSVALDAWSTNPVGELRIVSAQGALEVAFNGAGRFRLVCLHLDVAHVSGYVSDRGIDSV